MKCLHFFLLAVSSLLLVNVGFSNALVNKPIDIGSCYSKTEDAKAVSAEAVLDFVADEIGTNTGHFVTDVGKITENINIILTSNSNLNLTDSTSLERSNYGVLVPFNYIGHDLVIEHLELSERIQASYWHLDYKYNLLRSSVKHC